MKRIAVCCGLAAAALGAAPACGPGALAAQEQAQKQAQKQAQVQVHDPVMAKEDGTFYVFSTGPGITFYSSSDMKSWRPEGRVFPGSPAWAKQVSPSFDGHVWAPDVHRHNGRYYLYYSISAFGKNTSAIGVTVNKTLNPRSSDYKWEDQGIVVQSVPGRDNWNAIDPNVIEDDKGNGWMSFGSFWSGIKLFKLNADWTRPAEPQEWKTIAARERPAFAPDAAPEPAEIEAPFIFRKDGYYYLFVSWGLCCQKEKSTYHVVVGRSRDVSGPYLDKDGKDMARGGGSLVIRGDSAWKALGHNSAYTFDGQDYLVLHAYETADRYIQKLKVLEMKWDGSGWPVVDQADLNRYQSKLLPAQP